MNSKMIMECDNGDLKQQSQYHEVRSRLESLFPAHPNEEEHEEPDDDVSDDWSVVLDLLQKLSTFSCSYSLSQKRSSMEEDPMGRLFISRLISRNPPWVVLDAALQLFPDALTNNPAAFFTACHYAPPSVVGHMMRHVIQQRQKQCDDKTCPYPWIVSPFISVAGAKAILEAYPQGVLQEQVSTGLCPLDYFIMGKEIAEQRNFDMVFWQKLKLMLVAAGSCQTTSCVSPVEVMLKRVLSRPDVWDDSKCAQHVIWLFHQLRFSDSWIFEKQNALDGRYPLHTILSHKCPSTHSMGLVAARELVKIVLEAYPPSARCHCDDDGGRLPLHMALANGWPCHDLLLCLYPEALDIPDPQSGLYPMAAAAAANTTPDHHHRMTSNSTPLVVNSLDITFELLRANPMHACRNMPMMGSPKGTTKVGA